MRDRIRERLMEYVAEAIESISKAAAKEKPPESRSKSGDFHQKVNEHTKAGFKQYMEQSAKFIRDVAPGTWADYADELRNGGCKLKQEIMHNATNFRFRAASLHPNLEFYLRSDLDRALDRLIKRKVEDFEFGIVEGKNMTATTHNTVNIINSEISNAVVEITQSGKDVISKDTAQQLEQLVNSDEIRGLPEETRLDVLDQAEGVIKELSSPVTDGGKVFRGLKRLGNFISSVASQSASKVVAELAVAYARAHGMPI